MKGQGIRRAVVFCIALVVVVGGLSLLTHSSAAAAPTTVFFEDDFSSATLKPGWKWVKLDATHWSLTQHPGFLRIVTEKGGLYGSQNTNRNLLVRAAPSGDFEVTTRLLFKPTQNFQIAGILIYQEWDNFLWLARAFCSAAPPTCQNNGIYFDHEEGGRSEGGNFATAVTSKKNTYLKIERSGKRYAGYFSDDGLSWTRIGKHVVASTFKPRIGLAAGTGGTQTKDIDADFDFFRVETP